MSRAIAIDPSASYWRRKLQDRRPTAAADQQPRRDVPPKLDHAPFGIKEEHVQPESHPEGVDASAPWDQEARPGTLPREQCQAEQAAKPRGRNRDLEAKDLGEFDASEANWSTGSHSPV
jgi:hypothetical protein